jgi:hypothetical protein
VKREMKNMKGEGGREMNEGAIDLEMLKISWHPAISSPVQRLYMLH